MSLFIWRIIFVLIAIAYLHVTGWFEQAAEYLSGRDDGF